MNLERDEIINLLIDDFKKTEGKDADKTTLKLLKLKLSFLDTKDLLLLGKDIFKES